MNICTDMVDFCRHGHNCRMLHIAIAYKLVATVAEKIGLYIHLIHKQINGLLDVSVVSLKGLK